MNKILSLILIFIFSFQAYSYPEIYGKITKEEEMFSTDFTLLSEIVEKFSKEKIFSKNKKYGILFVNELDKKNIVSNSKGSKAVKILRNIPLIGWFIDYKIVKFLNIEYGSSISSQKNNGYIRNQILEDKIIYRLLQNRITTIETNNMYYGDLIDIVRTLNLRGNNVTNVGRKLNIDYLIIGHPIYRIKKVLEAGDYLQKEEYYYTKISVDFRIVNTANNHIVFSKEYISSKKKYLGKTYKVTNLIVSLGIVISLIASSISK